MNFRFLLSMVFITMILDLWSLTMAELFTAVAQLKPLLNTYKKIIDNLDEYIANEEKRLAVLKTHLNRYKKEQTLATEDISDYLENPINAFTLIKRLTIDLEFIQNISVVGLDYVQNITTKIPNVTYPSSEDLTGAVHGLTRLQATYRLDIGELAEGRLNEMNSSIPMTASDCFEVGQMLFDHDYFPHSLPWMMESLRKVRSGDDLFNISEVDVLEYISFTHYEMGDIITAIEWSKRVLMLDPQHPRVSGNVEYFQKELEAIEKKAKRKEETGKKEKDDHEGDEHLSELLEIEHYEALCRGEIDIPREIQKRLTCSYLTKNHPFLMLAPIKMEQIYIKPDVFLFHEVMSDAEINHIRNMAEPNITRAEVVDPETGEGMTAPYRISKVSWLREEDSQVVARVTQRAADFTGFTMQTAEELQVANYGIGGHYEPHYDYEQEDSDFMPLDGNRIATVLFYMSDVTRGGATVFTELGLTVFPIKNSALFWNNLLPSGAGDIATRHAACPVLRGSKWASNKWIHDLGQELIKPCAIDLKQ